MFMYNHHAVIVVTSGKQDAGSPESLLQRILFSSANRICVTSGRLLSRRFVGLRGSGMPSPPPVVEHRTSLAMKRIILP